MKLFSNLVFTTTLTFALSACAASQTQDDIHAESKTQTHAVTTKPGANVTMTSVLPKTMTPGEFQTVQLSFVDNYQNGDLTVEVVPSEGLQLFGGAAVKTFDMTKGDAHDWDIDVSAKTEGVYFLNIFATANGVPRSFSVRLDMGQVTQKMFNDAMPADGQLTDEGTVRVLEATETIK